jgi:hypothetical protein
MTARSRTTSWAALLLAAALVAAGSTAATAGSTSGGTSVTSATSDGAHLDPDRLGSRTGGPAPRLATNSTTSDTEKVQHITVSWKGTQKYKDYNASAVVPGIGNVTLVCKPSSTMVRLYASDRNAETQMWMAKYETKNDHAVVAVKTARIYRYADAADDGTGGTGYYSHEGLNQRTPVENYSSGYMDGIISQRPGRNQPASGAAMKPVTSFQLNWYWNGFDHPEDYRSCKIDAVFTTRLDNRLGVNWHGEADAEGNVFQVSTLPAIGDMLIRCETNNDGAGGVQSIALVPTSKNSSVYVEYVTGEGRVEDHVDGFSSGYDPETGKLGPFPLPRNGMLRLFFTVDGKTRAYIVSSYFVTNNGRNPGLNVCEVAAAAY